MEHEKCDNNIYYDSKSGVWFLLVQGNFWDVHADGYDEINVEISYCPHCGTKLKMNGEVG